MAQGQDTRPPRGAVIVIVVGLVATLLAAWLSADASGGGVSLSWDQTGPIADSRKAPLPGGGSAQIEHGQLAVTLPSVSGYKLYRVAGRLTIDADSATGNGKAMCRVLVPSTTIVAHTIKGRGSYPKPSGDADLIKQGVPPEVTLKFNARGSDLVAVELDDAFGTYTVTKGVRVDWAPYQRARQEFDWVLPPGRPQQPIRLSFASIWRTTRQPKARIACAVTTSRGVTQMATSGSLHTTAKPPQPSD